MGASCADELIRVKILPDDDRYFQVGASMKDEDRVGMLMFLMQNMDVFAWSPYEVPRVDPKFIVHRLKMNRCSFPRNKGGGRPKSMLKLLSKKLRS